MSSKKRSRSRSRQSSEERSVSLHKHSKRRRSETSSRDSNNNGNAMSSNPAAFDEILKQISGISEVVNNLGQRLSSLEAAKDSDRNNNNNAQKMAHGSLSHDETSGNVDEIHSMDQLSVMVPPDQDFVESIAPETLENDLGQ